MFFVTTHDHHWINFSRFALFWEKIGKNLHILGKNWQNMQFIRKKFALLGGKNYQNQHFWVKTKYHIKCNLPMNEMKKSDSSFIVFNRVVAGGLIAFFMEVAEYLLVSYTSGLTLSVAGIVKEILSLGLAIVIESTDISAVNAVGLVVCMAGITLHVIRYVLCSLIFLKQFSGQL